MTSRIWSARRAASCVVVTKGGTVAAATLNTARPLSPASALAACPTGTEKMRPTTSAESSSLAVRRPRSVADFAGSPTSAAMASIASPLFRRSVRPRAFSARRRAISSARHCSATSPRTSDNARSRAGSML